MGSTFFYYLILYFTYGNINSGMEGKKVATSYGLASGFTALGKEELALVNGGKGSSSSSSSSSSGSNSLKNDGSITGGGYTTSSTPNGISISGGGVKISSGGTTVTVKPVGFPPTGVDVGVGIKLK